MLSFRLAATRRSLLLSLPRFSRPISTEGSVHDETIQSEALRALGAGLPAPAAPVQPQPTASVLDIPKGLMNIPQEEDPLLHYFTSSILTHGHRARASRITSQTLLYIHAFTRAPPLPILREAILAASPMVRTLMHRHAAKTTPKPIALGEKQRTRYGVKWIIEASERQSGKTFEERLAREIISVVQGNSEAVNKKKMEAHRFAMVNRGNIKTR